jgi:hypothetical protein
MTRSLLLLLLPSVALAQLPPGKDCYCWPPGARAVQTVEVVFGGSDWTPDVRFFLADPRVRFEQLGLPGEVHVPEPPFWVGIRSFDNDPRLPREVRAKLTLPADLPPGPVRWSVANANGAAVGGVFVVGTGDEGDGGRGPQGCPAPSRPAGHGERSAAEERGDRPLPVHRDNERTGDG